MTQMVFRHGNAKKWKGIGYDFEIITENELQEYLEAGWFSHPDDLLSDSSEPEVKERKKPGPKPKAATDESND